MAHTEPSAKILDLVYSAAGNPEIWPSVMNGIAHSLDAAGGILYGKSVRMASASQVHFEHNGGLDEACNEAYRARHIQNAWTLAMYRMPIGRVVISDEICRLDELRRTEFYDEVLRPQAVGHSVMIALAGESDFRVAFNICRGVRRGPFDEGQRRQLSQLVPHLQRSLLLGFRLNGYQELLRAQHRALDRLNIGIVLLDRAERPIFVNEKARSLAASAGSLRLGTRGISTWSVPLTSRLSRLVRAVVQGQPAAAMSLPGPTGLETLSVIITSVMSPDRETLFDNGMRDAAVLVFLIDPAEQEPIASAALVEAFGLTQAEARVAAVVAAGKTIQETALILGLSVNTIKTHLRHVFGKLGISRQADLAARVATFKLIGLS